MAEEKIRRPIKTKGIKAVDQLGILVLDGSGSMGKQDASGRGTKAEAVGEVVKGLITRLQGSTRSPDFSLSLIAFDDQVELPPRLSPTPVDDIDLNSLNTNPLLGGQTAIGDALEKAGEIAQEFLNLGGELPRKVLIMLMSDGQNVTGKDPLIVSQFLKEHYGEKCKICCVAYGADADQETLKKICSELEDKYFRSIDDPETLRTFFEASMMAVE